MKWLGTLLIAGLGFGVGFCAGTRYERGLAAKNEPEEASSRKDEVSENTEEASSRKDEVTKDEEKNEKETYSELVQPYSSPEKPEDEDMDVPSLEPEFFELTDEEYWIENPHGFDRIMLYWDPGRQYLIRSDHSVIEDIDSVIGNPILLETMDEENPRIYVRDTFDGIVYQIDLLEE